MDTLTFDVVVPHVVLDGEEFTLLSDEELKDRRVGEQVLRERAQDITETQLRELRLLPEGSATEEQLQTAREAYAKLTASRYSQELDRQAEVLSYCAAEGIEVFRPKYTLQRPREEDLAAAREASSQKSGRLDDGLYWTALATALFRKCDRTDVPSHDQAQHLSPELLRKLGRFAHEKGSLGVDRLAFVLRSRRLSVTEAPSHNDA